MVQPPANIAAALSPGRVVILPGMPTKSLVISALADAATGDLSAHDRVAFIRAVLEREDVTPTAIGCGMAIPHARSPAIERCRIAVGVLPQGVVWGASDGQPIHLALLIAAREADHIEHLRLMAALAMRLRRPGLVQQLQAMTDRTAIVTAILEA